MFKRWIIFLVFLLVICVVVGILMVNVMDSNDAVFWDAFSAISAMGVIGVLVISLIARSINQGRLVIFKPLFPLFIKIFEGMTFFKWGILIIGLVIALAFLQIAEAQQLSTEIFERIQQGNR